MRPPILGLDSVNLTCHGLGALNINKAPGVSDDHIGATQATIIYSYKSYEFARFLTIVYGAALV